MFLVNETHRELTPCKIFHICHCAFNVLMVKEILVSSANIIQLNKRGALDRLLTYTTNRSCPRIDPRETTQVTDLRFALLFSSISMYFFLLD